MARIKYTPPSYQSYGKNELVSNVFINCAKGSIGAKCKGEATGTVCSSNTGVLCSGIGGIGIICDSESTGAICSNGSTPFTCKDSAQSTPNKDSDDCIQKET